jgi:cyclophilin family peptidyl-prolyl cis-trans isomerase
MKLTFRRLLFIVFLVVIAALYFNSLHNRSLPTGKIVQTGSVGLGTENITPIPITGRPQIEVSTTKGNFIIELRPDLAQETVINFLNKWAVGDCNFLTFYQVDDWSVKACDPNGDGTGGQDILTTEISSVSFTRGSVGVDHKSPTADKSNNLRFFIVKKDSPSLNSRYT